MRPRSLVASVRDWLRGRRPSATMPTGGIDLEFAGWQLTDVRPLQRPGRPRSKAGNLAWFARTRTDGRPIKILRCASSAQAELIDTTSRDPLLSGHLPSPVFRVAEYVAVEWIEGEGLEWSRLRHDEELREKVAFIQASVHSRAAPATTHGSFDYERFMLDRARGLSGILPLGATIDRLERDLGSGSSLQARLSHPDITAANLVIQQGSGRLVIIDNELLNWARLPMIDLLNTCFSEGQSRAFAERYLGAYARHGDATTLVTHATNYVALWNLRLLGSLLARGAAREAMAAGAAYEKAADDPTTSHPLLAAARTLS